MMFVVLANVPRHSLVVAFGFVQLRPGFRSCCFARPFLAQAGGGSRENSADVDEFAFVLLPDKIINDKH